MLLKIQVRDQLLQKLLDSLRVRMAHLQMLVYADIKSAV